MIDAVSYTHLVAAIVGTYFLIVSVGYILNTVTNCYLGALNGMGKPSKSMFLMIFYYIVVRMPLAYLLSYLGFGLNGIWVAVLVSHVEMCIRDSRDCGGAACPGAPPRGSGSAPARQSNN